MTSGVLLWMNRKNFIASSGGPAHDCIAARRTFCSASRGYLARWAHLGRRAIEVLVTRQLHERQSPAPQHSSTAKMEPSRLQKFLLDLAADWVDIRGAAAF